MDAGCCPRLRQDHRSEFAGAYKTDGDRLSGFLTLKQFGVKVHAFRSCLN
jgi:hypothetical protein